MTQPMALIHPDAQIGKDVIIDPFAVVGPDVEIGDGTHIFSGATVMEGARIGKNCKIYPGAVVSGPPQDLKFRGEKTVAIIGDNTTLRECSTVNRGTASRGKTIVGSNCLIMTYTHIGHDCEVGNNVIISNASQIAGEVEIADCAVIGGGTLIHQFSRIGAYVMTQGGTHINKDIPPFSIVARDPIIFAGLNIVGLERRGFSKEDIAQIHEMYRIIYQGGLPQADALAKIEAELPESKYRDMVVDFVRGSSRGIVRPPRR